MEATIGFRALGLGTLIISIPTILSLIIIIIALLSQLLLLACLLTCHCLLLGFQGSRQRSVFGAWNLSRSFARARDGGLVSGFWVWGLGFRV